MKIIIDPNLCINCGTCTIIDSSTFALDEKTSKAKVAQQPSSLTKETKSAIESCPVNAIKILKEEK